MRISWYSNAPWAPTGYGTQSAQVLRRMRQDGHELAVLANYGLMGMALDWEGITVYPGGVTSYSTDVADDLHRYHLDGQPGWLIALYDVWVLKNAWEGQRVAGWVPVDHLPVPPEVASWCRKHRTIAMSQYGQEELARAGIKADYIPHAIERVFQPTPSDIRARLQIPEDAFLVAINAANQGLAPCRKAWPEMLQAYGRFQKDRPDAYLYLHTDLARPNGINVPGMLEIYQIDPRRVRSCDQTAYRIGAIPQSYMAEIYTAADVLLSTSMGEGFGLAVLEAQACGTPVIVTDFSAQSELVGAGWKVRWQGTYDPPQGSFLAMPNIADIYNSLQAAYEARGDSNMAAQALAKAAEYDADKVYSERWRPLLADLESDMRKPMMKRKGKRR